MNTCTEVKSLPSAIYTVIGKFTCVIRWAGQAWGCSLVSRLAFWHIGALALNLRTPKSEIVLHFCNPSLRVWESIECPFEEQPVLLTVGPSLQDDLKVGEL